jgi:hypothetical protein
VCEGKVKVEGNRFFINRKHDNKINFCQNRQKKKLLELGEFLRVKVPPATKSCDIEKMCLDPDEQYIAQFHTKPFQQYSSDIHIIEIG